MTTTNKVVPMHKRLTDKRVKKVITFDTETAPFYEVVEPYTSRTSEKPFPFQVYSGEVREYTNRNGKLMYEYVTNTKCRQIIFDIGWVVGDKQGNIFKKERYIVKEVFLNMSIMQRAFYFEKYPKYVEELANGEVKLVNWTTVKAALEQDIVQYRIDEMYAYNVAFDWKTALNNTQAVLTNRTEEFTMFRDYQMKINCLWGMACETILLTKEYAEFCVTYGFVSASGNIQTSAEVAYKFLTNNPEYIEEHTALEDSIIEHEILGACFKSRKKMSFGIINQPWKMVTDNAKAKGWLPEATLEEKGESDDSN